MRQISERNEEPAVVDYGITNDPIVDINVASYDQDTIEDAKHVAFSGDDNRDVVDPSGKSLIDYF